MDQQTVHQLVKATIPVLREHGVALTTHFYQRMFHHNPELLQIFNRSHNATGKQPMALAGSVLAYAENIDDPSVLAPVVNLIAHKHASLGIRAEHYPIVGKHLLASIQEVLGDAASPELIEAWAIAYQKLADIFIQAENQLYYDATNQEGGWSGWRPFKISRKVIESAEITSFYLVPSDGGALPRYRAGQYTTVRVFVPAWNVVQPRQYTLSDAPNGEYFRISVKREAGNNDTPAGQVSNRLHEAFHEGDMIDLAPPFGDFFLDEDSTAPLLLISGGVGITPMMAILNRLLALNSTRPVHFIHACRNADVFAFGESLQQLAATHAHLQLHLFHDQAPVGSTSAQIAPLQLSDLAPVLPLAEAECYLCGPVGFMQTHIAALQQLGVSKQRIHAELFSTGGIHI